MLISFQKMAWKVEINSSDDLVDFKTSIKSSRILNRFISAIGIAGSLLISWYSFWNLGWFQHLFPKSWELHLHDWIGRISYHIPGILFQTFYFINITIISQVCPVRNPHLSFNSHGFWIDPLCFVPGSPIFDQISRLDILWSDLQNSQVCKHLLPVSYLLLKFLLVLVPVLMQFKPAQLSFKLIHLLVHNSRIHLLSQHFFRVWKFLM